MYHKYVSHVGTRRLIVAAAGRTGAFDERRRNVILGFCLVAFAQQLGWLHIALLDGLNLLQQIVVDPLADDRILPVNRMCHKY